MCISSDVAKISSEFSIENAGQNSWTPSLETIRSTPTTARDLSLDRLFRCPTNCKRDVTNKGTWIENCNITENRTLFICTPDVEDRLALLDQIDPQYMISASPHHLVIVNESPFVSTINLPGYAGNPKRFFIQFGHKPIAGMLSLKKQTFDVITGSYLRL